MTVVRNDPIPESRINQFHEILCATNGRYLCNPFHVSGDGVYLCDYAPGDYAAQCEAWSRVITNIKEIRRDQWWRKLLRRVVFL